MENPTYTENSPPPRKKVGFWRKLGGGSLTLSIFIHAIILLLGAIWIIRIIPPPKEKTVDFINGGGGGNPASQSISQQKQRTTMTKPNLSRISVAGVSSNITLPEMDDSVQMPTLGSLTTGGMSGGLGGSGAGGGRGDGIGKGFGSGTGPGAGLGGAKENPFGLADPNVNALEGVFYDLKQTKNRKPTDVTPDSTREIIADFTKRGWKESSLRNYYRATQKLYQTKIYMPLMQAESAPAAFDCDKEVQPRCWIVIYRGTVVPPKSGRFRFVGAGDDVLVVRFNGRTVFDHGFTSGTTGIHLSQNISVLREEQENKDIERLLKRDYPMKLPVTFYQYPTTRNWNGAIGGLAVGPEFEVSAGRPYPIEILISEIPGGLFCASLMIEEVGVKYQTVSSGGAPILPVFRTDASLPKQEGDNAPPFDPTGPIWKVQRRSVSIDF